MKAVEKKPSMVKPEKGIAEYEQRLGKTGFGDDAVATVFYCCPKHGLVFLPGRRRTGDVCIKNITSQATV